MIDGESNAGSGRKTDSQDDQVAHRFVGAEEVVKEEQYGRLNQGNDQNVGKTQGVKDLERDRAVSHGSRWKKKPQSSWRFRPMGVIHTCLRAGVSLIAWTSHTCFPSS